MLQLSEGITEQDARFCEKLDHQHLQSLLIATVKQEVKG